MALLPLGVVRSIQVINSVRNKIAHDLNFEISKDDEQKVVNSIPEFLQVITKDLGKRSDGPLTLKEALVVIVLHSEVQRTRHAAERELGRKAQLHLRKVLDEVRPMLQEEGTISLVPATRPVHRRP